MEPFRRPVVLAIVMLPVMGIAIESSLPGAWAEEAPSKGTRRVRGRVTLNGQGLGGVTVTAVPDGTADVTAADGSYFIRIPYYSKGWTGTVRASHPDYVFDPPERVYTNFKNHVDDQDFVALEAPATPPPSEPEQPQAPAATRRVSGVVTLNSVGLPGVTVSAWPNGGTAVTDARGEYLLRIPYVSKGWNGTITASHPDYTFDPPVREYTNWKDHISGQNFVALETPAPPKPSEPEPPQESTATRRVSGVVTLNSVGLPGVTVSAWPNGGTAVTDARGEYLLRIPYVSKGWNGTITASHPDYTFDPPVREYTNWKDHVKNQNFTARPISGGPVGDDGAEPPTALPAVVLVERNTPATITLSGQSPHGAALTFSIVSAPAHGTLSTIEPAAPGQAALTYTPAKGYRGADAFTFTVHDGTLASAPAAVDLSVSAARVSGYARRSEADGSIRAASGATVTFTALDGATTSVTTGADGGYSTLLPDGWSGQAVVTWNEEVSFFPAVRTYQSLRDPRAGEDYGFSHTWYVHPDGNDANNGSKARPFGSIQAAAHAAMPGDTILLRGGTYILNNDPRYGFGMVYFPRSGEEGRPITLAGHPGEAVTIRTTGSKPVFDFSPAYDHPCDGFGHFVFRNFRITGGRYGWWIQPSGPSSFDPARQPISDLWVNQFHDFLIEDIEVDGNGSVESAIYVRGAGIRNLTVRRCRFHHTVGTEGTIDIGEWKDTHPAHAIPMSGSHDLLFEDVDMHHAQHQQASGIVTQPCTFNVTLRRCRAWNNGKYGFACKGSGNFRLDRCAAWGNDSSQMYARGFGGDSGAYRPPYAGTQVMTNCVFIAPADQRGGGALNWRENTHLEAYNCTIVGLRDGKHNESGGYAFLEGNAHATPCTAHLVNCIVAGYTDANAMRLSDSDAKVFMINTRYEGATNLFWSQMPAGFRYVRKNLDFAAWQAYWATGEPDGDDALRGPRATWADATSLFGEPGFVEALPDKAPLRRAWSDDLLDPAHQMDVRVRPDSPAVSAGQNLSELGIPELSVDYAGRPRPNKGAWTIGAFEVVR